MAKYRTKPVEVEAMRLTQVRELWRSGAGPAWLHEALGRGAVRFEPPGEATIRTLEGDVVTPLESWLVRGALGEIWPVQDKQFAHKYEQVE